jgi:hypothetical protein
MPIEQTSAPTDARPLDAFLAIALQLKARLDARDGLQRSLGNEAVFLRSFGYKNPEIAAILGSTPASVAELISRTQKAATGRKSGRPRGERSKVK